MPIIIAEKQHREVTGSDLHVCKIHAIDDITQHSGLIGVQENNLLAISNNGLPKDSGIDKATVATKPSTIGKGFYLVEIAT